MRVQLSSLSFMANRKTQFVHFLCLPIINMILFLFIHRQFTGGDVLNPVVAVTSVAVAAITISLSSVSQLLTHDSMRGVDKIMVINRPYSPRYWGNKILTAMVVSWGLMAINLGLLAIVGVDWVVISRIVLASPALLVTGVLLGMLGFFLAWRESNPYFYTNLLSAATPIIYGVIVSVSEYPPVFKVFSQIFPFYNVRDYLQTGQWEHLAIEGIKLVVLIIITGIVYQLKHKKVVDKKGLLF